MKRILIVDDELGIRELLREILSDEGYSCVVAPDAKTARAALANQQMDLAILDYWLPDEDGIALLHDMRRFLAPRVPVILMSGHGTVETAVEATRAGAVDYLEKPIALQRLLKAVERGLQADPRPSAAQSDEDAPAPASKLSAAELEMLLELPIREARHEFERRYMLYHLSLEDGSVARLAKKTGMERTHLYRKLRTLGLPMSRLTGGPQEALEDSSSLAGAASSNL